MTFCGTPFNKERTAARSPALAAVTSGTLVVSAASAAPARIEELSSPAKMVAHLFIGILPLETVLSVRSGLQPSSATLDRPSTSRSSHLPEPTPSRSGWCAWHPATHEGPRCARGPSLNHTLARQNERLRTVAQASHTLNTGL